MTFLGNRLNQFLDSTRFRRKDVYTGGYSRARNIEKKLEMQPKEVKILVKVSWSKIIVNKVQMPAYFRLYAISMYFSYDSDISWTDLLALPIDLLYN